MNHYLRRRMGADLSLTAHRDAIDVDRNGYDQPRSSHVAAADTGTSVVVEHNPRLDPFPLGATVLEPDLHLDLAEAQLAGDQRTLGQRQVFFAGELAFQPDELVAAERRPSSSSTSMKLVRRALEVSLGATFDVFVIVVGVGSVVGIGGLRPREVVVD